MCCDVGLVSEFRLTAGCVLMDLASPAASQAAVYANGLNPYGSYLWGKLRGKAYDYILHTGELRGSMFCITPDISQDVVYRVLWNALMSYEAHLQAEG